MSNPPTATTTPPLSILFVCLGNICRSPMAEGVFRSLVQHPSSPSSKSKSKSNPRIATIDSAGTGAYHTLEPPDYRTMQTLHKHGITDYDHGARKVRDDDFQNFDYIFAMDAANLRDLERIKRRLEGSRGEGKEVKAKVMLFGTYSGRVGKGGKGVKAEEVVDPYYGSDDGFGEVFEQVSRFSRNFLREVVEKELRRGEVRGSE